MRRLALLALLLGVALLAGTAQADTFAVVPPSYSATARCPCFRELTPNASGSVALPFDLSRRARVAGPALLRAAARPLAARRLRVRDPVAGARRDQQGRVELRPQHGPELGRRDRLDAVHARHLAALGHRRERRRRRRPVEPGRRDRLRGALPRRGRRHDRPLPRRLRLQPRRLVREGSARPGEPLRLEQRRRASRSTASRSSLDAARRRRRHGERPPGRRAGRRSVRSTSRSHDGRRSPHGSSSSPTA